MKKIFTLFAATMMAAGAMAQGYVLDANRILKTYINYDGTSVVNDEDHDMETSFNSRRLNFPFTFNDGAVNKNLNKITLTQAYTDSETGFTVPAGDYTTLCGYTWWSAETGTVKDELNMSFYTSDLTHISNIKKIIVYAGGTNMSYADAASSGDYKELRVTGTNIYVDGAKYSNSVGGEEATRNWLGRSVCYGLPADGVIVDGAKREFTQSKLYRIVIDLATPHDPDDFSEMDGAKMRSANDGDNPTMKKLDKGAVDGTGHATADEYIYNITHKFVDTTGDGGNQAPGYCSYDIPWAKNVGYSLQVKKFGHIFGIAFISGEDGAKTYIGDTTAGRSAAWEELSPTGINAVNAEPSKVTPRKQLVNGQIVIGDYNIAGQRVK